MRGPEGPSPPRGGGGVGVLRRAVHAVHAVLCSVLCAVFSVCVHAAVCGGCGRARRVCCGCAVYVQRECPIVQVAL